jgi:hypothetical protein
MSILRPSKPVDLDQANGKTEVEGEIRDFVRRDVTQLRRPVSDAGSEIMANNVGSLVQRVTTTSVQEIDALIAELQALRDILQSEGERVQREIAGYAQLSQSATASTRVISEGLTQWKSAFNASRQQPRT